MMALPCSYVSKLLLVHVYDYVVYVKVDNPSDTSKDDVEQLSRNSTDTNQSMVLVTKINLKMYSKCVPE